MTRTANPTSVTAKTLAADTGESVVSSKKCVGIHEVWTVSAHAFRDILDQHGFMPIIGSPSEIPNCAGGFSTDSSDAILLKELKSIIQEHSTDRLFSILQTVRMSRVLRNLICRSPPRPSFSSLTLTLAFTLQLGILRFNKAGCVQETSCFGPFRYLYRSALCMESTSARSICL